MLTDEKLIKRIEALRASALEDTQYAAECRAALDYEGERLFMSSAASSSEMATKMQLDLAERVRSSAILAHIEGDYPSFHRLESRYDYLRATA